MMPEKSKWRRPTRLVPLVFMGLALVGLIALRAVSNSGVKGEVAAIQKRGLPVNEKELDAWYKPVPAAENAAILYVEAAAEYVDPPASMNPSRMGELAPGEPMPDELKEAVALLMEENELTLEKIDAAAKLKASRYPIDLSKGFATLLPHLANLKKLAQLSSWAAVQRSGEGKPDEAVRILKNGFALAVSLEEEPLVISELVRIACLSILLNGLEHVVSEHQLNNSQLAQLNDLLRRAELHGRRALQRAFAGERSVGISAFNMSYQELDQLGAGTPSGKPMAVDVFDALWFGVRRASGMHAQDLAFYLTVMGGWEKALKKDFPEMLTAAEATTSMMDRELGRHRMKYTISGMILPAMSSAAKKEAAIVARLRCAQMALAIEKHRLQNGGKLPDADDLAILFQERIPRDPVDGSPLKYIVQEKKGYAIAAARSIEKTIAERGNTNKLDALFKFRVMR